MSAAKKTVSLLLMVSMLMLIVFLPKYAAGLLNGQSMRDWMMPKKESFSGVISCWHVVRFRPYKGSMGAWLEKYARRMEKRHYGVYFEVESISEAEALRRIDAGVLPDIISFPKGMLDEAMLQPLKYDDRDGDGSEVRAVPLAASCELILVYPEKWSEDRAKLEETARDHTFEEFRPGKVPCCITDARGAGDMQRLLLADKAEYFDVEVFDNETELVQFMGVLEPENEDKIPYELEFMELILSEKAQTDLVEMGLMPMNSSVPLHFEQSFLSDAYRLISESGGVRMDPFD